jgi:hypothetical protein
MWRVTRGFMVWFFLSWGIDYRIKNVKTNSGRMTSLTFFHPISHGVLIREGFTSMIRKRTRILEVEKYRIDKSLALKC